MTAGRASKFMGECWRRYGVFVGRHPLFFLLFPLVFALAMAPGFKFIKIQADFTKLFTSPGASSELEMDRTHFYNLVPHRTNCMHHQPAQEPENFDMEARIRKRNIETMRKQEKNKVSEQVETTIQTFIVYVSKLDRSNVLTVENLENIYNVLQDFQNNFSFNTSVKNETSGKRSVQNWTYKDDFCFADKCYNLGSWIPLLRAVLELQLEKNNPRMKLTYPNAYLLGKRYDITKIMYGLTLEEGSMRVLEVKALALVVLIRHDQKNHLGFLQLQQHFIDHWYSRSGTHGLKFVTFNFEMVNQELFRLIFKTLPFLNVSAVLLTLFVLLSAVERRWVTSKVLESALAIVSVTVSLVASFGLLFYAGVEFNPIVTVTFFFVIAIGVDDAFLLLNAWRLSSGCPESRMGQMLQDAGSAITITSLTDCVCFGVGIYFCQTPAVRTFCTFTTLAIAMDFLFQVSFFAAILCYSGRAEAKNRNFLCACCSCGSTVRISPSSLEKVAVPPHSSPISKFFRAYAEVILSKPARIVSALVYLLYLGTSFVGIRQIRIENRLDNMVLDDSPMREFTDIAREFVWTTHVDFIFHVTKPPNFQIEANRLRFETLLDRLESIHPYSMNKKTSKIWYRDHLDFCHSQHYNLNTEFYSKLRLFLRMAGNTEYVGRLKWSENCENLTGFSFDIMYTNLWTTEDRMEVVKQIRNILAEYDDWTAFSNSIHHILADQLKAVGPQSLQTLGLVLLAMLLISVCFMPNGTLVFYVISSLFSMMCGVMGFLKFWGADLDHVTLIFLLMAIGVAVDFAAHVCYCIHRSDCDSMQGKVSDGLVHIGWPLLQAGISTMLGVLPLAFVPAYIIQMAFRTMTLVVMFGLLHALVFLPQFFMHFRANRKLDMYY